LSGTIGDTFTDTKLRYKIIDYVPPEQIPRSTSLPTPCDVFTSLAGGSAQITVEGTVERPKSGSSGDVVVARYTLTRSLDVQGWPFLNLPADWLSNQIFPGPPVSLRIGNQGTGLGSVTSAIYSNFESDLTTKDLENTMGSFRPQCRSCTSPLANGVTTSIPANDVDLPRFFPFPNAVPDTDPLASQRPATRMTLNSNTSASDLRQFPYSNSGTSNSGNNLQLQDGCYFNVDPARPKEIDCWINSIAPGVNLTVNTVNFPVNLIILGNVGGIDDLSSSQKPAASAPLNQVPTTNFVTIKHCVDNCGSSGQSPTLYSHSQLSNFQPQYRRLWNRLRIFGFAPPSPLPTVCSSQQTFYIRAAVNEGGVSGTSLSGAFVWLPRGRLIYGNQQDTNGYVWVPNATNTDYIPAPSEVGPSELLTSWWVCDLDFRISNSMKFILPLYGNPDAVRAFLPGAYQNTNNAFVSDLRFPVYPLLPRIRNAY
jgi:hypothetical protein